MYVVGVDLVKVCKAFVRLVSGGILCPLSDVYVRSFLCPFVYFDKTLLHTHTHTRCDLFSPSLWVSFFFHHPVYSKTLNGFAFIFLFSSNTPVMFDKMVSDSWVLECHEPLHL